MLGGVTVLCVMGETLFWWRPESVMMGTLVYILTKLAQGSQHTLGPSSSQVSNHNIPKIEYAELFERLIPKLLHSNTGHSKSLSLVYKANDGILQQWKSILNDTWKLFIHHTCKPSQCIS